MSILHPSIQRALSAGARKSLLLLVAVALSARLAPPAQASQLLVSSGDRVLRYAETTGDFVDVLLASGSGGLARSQGMAFGPDGSLYVCCGSTPIRAPSWAPSCLPAVVG
jgi:hypothetical protein